MGNCTTSADRLWLEDDGGHACEVDSSAGGALWCEQSASFDSFIRQNADMYLTDDQCTSAPDWGAE